MFGKWIGIDPMSLSATLEDYKNQEWFRISNYPQKYCKGLTQLVFVPPGTTIIYTTEESLKTLTRKPWWILLKNCGLQTKKW